jgi:periplasmic protein TonB
MKRFLLMLTCLVGFTFTHGQTAVSQVIIKFSKEKKKSKTFAKVEIKGAYPEGDTTWRSYLEKNLNASLVVGKGAKKGKYTVVIRYVVSKDGTISDIQCENDPGYGMCQEAVRIMKKSKSWTPATQPGGRNVYPYRH